MEDNAANGEPPTPTSPSKFSDVGGDQRFATKDQTDATKDQTDVDPIFALRSKQWSEYEKLCLELRLKQNSGVRSVLYPREDNYLGTASRDVDLHEVNPTKQHQTLRTTCDCGNVFATDAIFCRKCGRGRGFMPVDHASVCSCGNTFAQDAVFCRKCGSKRKAASEPEEEAADSRHEPRSVHEYNFSRIYIGDLQLQPLTGALAVDRQMVALLLPGIGMKDNGMIKLCEQLKRSPSLEFMDISENRFSIGGAEACLRLVTGAQRLVIVKSKDTCLDEEFCNKRGLPAKYAAVRKDIADVLIDRALSL